MCDLARTHWCMQVEISLEVATLDVSTPLVVALDGGATVLPTSTVVDFLPEARRLVAGHRRAVLHLWACTWQHWGTCAMDASRAVDGKRDCCADGWCRPSRCGVLMATVTSWSTS
jgi:hypothetical protein